jgi:hypothetical protein
VVHRFFGTPDLQNNIRIFLPQERVHDTSAAFTFGLTRKKEKARMRIETIMKEAEIGLVRKILKLPLEMSRA